MTAALRYSLSSRLRTERAVVREFLAELIGTFFLVFIGLSANVQLAATAGSVTSLQLAWGIGFAFGVYLAAAVSGAHLNPAISLAALLVDGSIGAQRMVLYWLAQGLGAFAGAALAYVGHLDDVGMLEGAAGWSRSGAGAAVNGSGAEAGAQQQQQQPLLSPIAGLFTTFPAPHMTLLGAVADQVIGTAVLAGCLALITDKRHRIPSGVLPLLAGLIMMVVSMSYGANAGFAINPARDLGPRLFLLCCGYGWVVFYAHDYYFWVPLVGPFVGALLGTWVYKLFVGIHGLNAQLEINCANSVGNAVLENGLHPTTVPTYKEYKPDASTLGGGTLVSFQSLGR